MKLLVMRHGEAQLVAPSDMHRALTEYGVEQVQHTAQWLSEHILVDQTSIDLALVSPFLRTRQTFAQLNSELTIQQVESCPDIVPTSIASLAHDYLDAKITSMHNPQCILLVSHMPFVSYFVDALCQERIAPVFATGAVALIEYDTQLSRGKLVTHFQGI